MSFQAPLPDDSPPPRQPLFPTRSTTASTVDGGMSPATRTALKEVAADACTRRARRQPSRYVAAPRYVAEAGGAGQGGRRLAERSAGGVRGCSRRTSFAFRQDRSGRTRGRCTASRAHADSSDRHRYVTRQPRHGGKHVSAVVTASTATARDVSFFRFPRGDDCVHGSGSAAHGPASCRRSRQEQVFFVAPDQRAHRGIYSWPCRRSARRLWTDWRWREWRTPTPHLGSWTARSCSACRCERAARRRTTHHQQRRRNRGHVTSAENQDGRKDTCASTRTSWRSSSHECEKTDGS